MGCAQSSPASPSHSKLFSKANVPSPQHQIAVPDEIAASLAVLGLERYAPAFHEIGYDDLDTLDGFSQEELLQVAMRVNMKEGHAVKWIKSLSGSPLSHSKVMLAISAFGSSASGVSASGLDAVHIAEAQEQVTAHAEASSDKDERIIFWCIKADKLRNCEDRVLPRFQDLQRQRPDWFVEKEISLVGACAHEYADEVLAVSHRWEQPAEPDTQGKQFEAMCAYVRGKPAIKLVWVDFSCAPQKERTPAEEVVFERTLRFVSLLFLGSSVLILCDRTYTTRFWTLFEAWLSMQMASVDGLVPALREKRRCDIVPIHHANSLTVSELEALVAGKSLDQIHATLDSPDVSVTNQKDKGQQLAKLLALDSQVRQVVRDMALPSTRIGGTPRLLRAGAVAGMAADAPAPSKDERLQRLVELVRSGSADAAGALADMGDDESRVAIARAGGIVPLVALLTAQDPAAGAEAARALRNLSVGNDENRGSIAQAGAIPPLVALLQSGTDGQKENAAFALRTLAFNAGNQVAIALAGGVPPLVVLVQSGTDGQKEQAARVLWNLAWNNAENQLSIAKAGGIPPLVALLQSGTDGQKDAALGALKNLSINAENQVTIAQAGGIPPLVALVQTGTIGQKEQAAYALRNLPMDAENKASIAKFAAVADAAVAEAQRAAGGAVLSRLRGVPGQVTVELGGASATTSSRVIAFNCFSTLGALELLATSGVAYFEAVILEASSGCCPQLGFATQAFVTGDDAPYNAGAGEDAQSWGLDGIRKLKWSGESSPWACTWKVGDTIGLAASVDLGKIAVSKNGSWTGEENGVVFTDAAIKQGVYPALTASKFKLRCAFSATDFKYAPPPGDVWQSPAEARMLELEKQLAETKAAMERLAVLELEKQLAETKAAAERLAVEREAENKLWVWPWGA
jgi:hypothetical protein